ncbi:hypothetical protein PSTG_07330 [Puccinia striiformis f. sp. tritici PST-78]|uniref:Uncharacterized protein n=1 Tax=Puccinia striiformis f. sp. tritici PST-78 TaxID=1165861 RepID=A0A0L0VJE9_9BASI|nr:hypothetical protein PSTG_07330 [Puccinia striiformis f. sp. tritici PST-78]
MEWEAVAICGEAIDLQHSEGDPSLQKHMWDLVRKLGPPCSRGMASLGMFNNRVGVVKPLRKIEWTSCFSDGPEGRILGLYQRKRFSCRPEANHVISRRVTPNHKVHLGQLLRLNDMRSLGYLRGGYLVTETPCEIRQTRL